MPTCVRQKLGIWEYARRHDLKVDEFVEIAISSRKTTKQPRIDELLVKLMAADVLMVSELSRLGCSTAEVIGLMLNYWLYGTVRACVRAVEPRFKPA